MRKIYISDLIPQNVYDRWFDGRKIMINAPTGLGKTTFVIDVFLSRCQEKKKKALLLNNRRLLRKHYEYDLSMRYSRYLELCEVVEVMSYQEIAEYLKVGENVDELLREYDVIVLDECHYFYSDSDFNGWGTYVTLQAIIKAGYFKTMLFISATFDEVKPIIEQTLEQCKKEINSGKYLTQYDYEIEEHDYQKFADYSQFECCYAEDVETICREVAQSNQKSLWFIDDKKKAEKIKDKLIKQGGYENRDILILSSSDLEEKTKVKEIDELAIGHRIPKKILISTSVLDNGISIHDSEIGSIIIATESRVSFLQMLGRVRVESMEKCKLYIFPRSAEYYKRRVEKMELKLQTVREIEKRCGSKQVILRGWYGNDEKSEWIRQMLILTNHEIEYYSKKYGIVSIESRNLCKTINAFAVAKIGDLLLAEREFYKLAMCNPQKVAIRQFEWIGKKENQITFLESTYKRDIEEEIIEKLLAVKDATLKEVQCIKHGIAEKYHKEIEKKFKIPIKNNTFSTHKLKEICRILELDFNSYDSEDKTKRYTISRINGDK